MTRTAEQLPASGIPPSAPAATDWVALLSHEIPLGRAVMWAARADCGALVTFCGTVRDHSTGRAGVTGLEYEAYEPYATRMMNAIARDARGRTPQLGRLALLHRVGELEVGEVAVVVVVSAPHRAEAYAASRFCIDAVKSSVPIWKRETWAGGSSWVTCDHALAEPPEAWT